MADTKSPFIVHRDKILGHYSAASWLRGVVLSLWSGGECPVGLSHLASVDAAHYAAFSDMVAGYRAHGENDPAFMSLALEVREREAEDLAAKERSKNFENWLSAVKHELRVVGVGSDAADEDYNWFEAKYNANITAADAAILYSEEKP